MVKTGGKELSAISATSSVTFSLRQYLFFTLSVLLIPFAESRAQTDSLYESIHATTVTARLPDGLSALSADAVVLDMVKIRTLPMLLGSADPLNFAHYLPSMSARSELDAGVHIQGNDHCHNLVSSGGVPLYGVSHLLGLFSVFNPSHYGHMRYSTQTPDRNRLGGTIDMELPREAPDKLGGEVSAGLLSAQGTLKVPLGKKAGFALSARRSYINLLYGKFLNIEGNPVKYGFTDVNLTGIWTPGERDKLWLDAYFGNDSMVGGSPMYDLDGTWNWGNAMAALHWEHKADGGSIWHHKLYGTGYQSSLDALWTDLHAILPSRLVSTGYCGRWTLGAWTAGLESTLHIARPQSPQVEGGGAYEFPPQPRQIGWENTLLVRYALPIGPFIADMGLKGSLFLDPEAKLHAGVDPDLVLSANLYRAGKLEAHVGLQHQYLFQTGMTDLGFPLEFWFLAGKLSPPQMALTESLSYQLDFYHGMFSLSAEVYHRNLWNQVEYKGTLLDLINGSYDLDKALLKGPGRAFGVNLSLHKTAGALTGWISYAWGRSLRNGYPAAHERIHEFDAVLTWDVGRWSFGGTMVAASGVPYTGPDYLYLVGQQIVAQYGLHNGRRMKPYFRLDLSVNFFFHKGGRMENGLNFSLYNATGHNNELYYRLYYKDEESSDATFSYGPVHITLRFLPSLCYFHRF